MENRYTTAQIYAVREHIVALAEHFYNTMYDWDNWDGFYFEDYDLTEDEVDDIKNSFEAEIRIWRKGSRPHGVIDAE